MFANLKLYGLIAACVAIAGLASTAYIYKLKYDKADLQRASAIEQKEALEAINQNIIENIKKDAELRQQLYEDFKGARNEAESAKQKLASHDLSALAVAKPGLLTRLADRATQRVLDDIETAINQGTENVPESPASGHGEAKAPSAASHSD